MEVDIQNDVPPTSPKAEEDGDSWSELSDECSVPSDSSAAASVESTADEGLKGNSDPSPFMASKRRWTSCPEKKVYSTEVEKQGFPHFTFKRPRPTFKAKLATVFERVTEPSSVPKRRWRPPKRYSSALGRLGFSRYFRSNRTVDQVDQLMIHLNLK